MYPLYSLKTLRAGTKEIHSAKSAFFAGGFIMSTWAPMIPYIKQNLSISADILGLLLLSIGLAAFLFMPVAGILTRYLGCRAVVTGATLVMTAVLLSLPHLPALLFYFIALFILGAAMGTLDVGMNLNSVVVERVTGKRILSGVHAFWSIGCFCGAGLFTGLAKYGLSVPWIALIHGVIIGAAMLRFYPHLLPFHGDSSQKAISLPRGIILILGIMTCLSFLAEGAVMDWGGVLLTEAKGIDITEAGLGFASYSAATLAMRLVGDRIVQWAGEKSVIIVGSLMGALGFLGVTLFDSLPLLIGCFLFLGAGISNVVPVFYSILAHQKDMPVDAAVTVLTCMGYSGVILGPSLLGFLAQHSGILSVFLMLTVILTLQAGSAWHYIKSRC